VGGRQVHKDVLRDAFARAGGENPRTFIQSGNVAFDAKPDEAEAVVTAACRRLRTALGAEPLVMLRTVTEITRLLRRGPFAHTPAPAIVKRYIVFLAAPPARRPRLPVLLPKEALELVHVSKRECWVVSRRKPNGWYGFPVEFVEGAVGVPATARNWSTVTKLAALLIGGPKGPQLRTGRLKAAPTMAPTAPASRSFRRSRTSSTARDAASSTSGRAPADSRSARRRAAGR
jgi:uncharacterized protein (DUF1697 family)